MSDEAREFLMLGITAVHSGDKEEARRYLERSLNLDPDMTQQAEAWLWLSEVSDSPAEQRNCLEETLAIEPFNPRARRKLAILDGKLDPADVIDPDRPIERKAPPPDADPRRFVCPNCGGRLTYSPDGQSLVCESCTSRERLQTQTPSGPGPAGGGQDFVIAMATAAGHVHPEAARTITCQGCGANFMLPPESLSLACPYCNSVYVVEQAEDRELIAPQGLIPFKIDQAHAREGLQARHPEAIQGPSSPSGLYLPAWSFNLGGSATWNCLRYEERRWIPDSGEDYVLQDAVLVAACAKLQALYPGTISGFDLAELTTFDPRFLADWPAETYQVSVAEASLNAHQETVVRTRIKIESSFFHPTKDLIVRAPELAIDSFKLILLPFWVAAFAESGHPAIWVNGQTGNLLLSPGSAKHSGLLSRLFGV